MFFINARYKSLSARIKKINTEELVKANIAEMPQLLEAIKKLDNTCLLFSEMCRSSFKYTLRSLIPDSIENKLRKRCANNLHRVSKMLDDSEHKIAQNKKIPLSAIKIEKIEKKQEELPKIYSSPLAVKKHAKFLIKGQQDRVSPFLRAYYR